MTPAVVIRPILPLLFWPNHSAPSGPAAMSVGSPGAVALVNSAKIPLVVIRPILAPPNSVNHSAPSGPVVIPRGPLPAVGIEYSLIDKPARRVGGTATIDIMAKMVAGIPGGR